MIRVTMVGSGAERYYLDAVADGSERAGRWAGSARHRLELGHEVHEDQLIRLMEARAPGSGERLRTRPTKVRAYDVTITTPKSVSVAWALGNAEVASAVEAGGSQAVDSTAGYLERQGARLGRQGSGPAEMVGAVFAHRTSRSGDPFLHTHLLVLNLGVDESGRWGALDGRVLLAQAHTAGLLYQAELRYELSSRLGTVWGEVSHGVAQLEGVSLQLRELFSTRRAQVRAGMALHGGHSARSAQIAAWQDRPARNTELSAERMAPEWRRRAERAGFGAAVTLERVDQPDPGAEPAGEPRGPDRGPRPNMAAGPPLGLEELSSFSRREVLESLSLGLPGGAPIQLLERRADEFLASDAVPLPAGPPALRVRDVLYLGGHAVVIPTDQQRWVSRAAQEAEARVEHLVGLQRDVGRGQVDALEVDSRVVGWSAQLAGPLRSLLTSGHGVELLDVGPGPARDMVLAAAHEAWSHAGYRVVVGAPEERSQGELEAGAGLTVTSSARMLEDLGLLVGAGAPLVLVATGAERQGASAVAHLVEAAARLEAKLVLVGYPGPLPRDDRAGGWRAAERAAGSLSLARHVDLGAPERASSLVIPSLEPAPPAPELARKGSLVLSRRPEQLRNQLVADWADRPIRSAVMVAGRRADVEDLNQRARRLLSADGRLSGPEVRAGGLDVMQGELVAAVAIDGPTRRAGVVVGATMVARGSSLEIDDGRSVELARLGPGLQLRYAYAATPYQASRSRADRAFVLGAPLPAAPGAPPPSWAPIHYVVADPREVAARSAELTRAPHLLQALGTPPGGPGRQAWRRAAGEIEAYRSRWGVTDTQRALGGPAPSGLQRAQQREVARLVGSVRSRELEPSPVRDRSRPGIDKAPQARDGAEWSLGRY